MNRSWGRATLLLVGLAVVVIVIWHQPGAGATVTATATATESAIVLSTTTTPSALLAQAISDAEQGGWVHEVVHGAGDGSTFSAANDIGAMDGRQVIHEDLPKADISAEVIVLGQKAYIRGNTGAVSTYFGLTQNDPAQLANTWLSLVPSDPDFSTVSAAVTLRSDFSEQKLSGPLTEGRTVTMHGQSCVPIFGRVPVGSGNATTTAAMYVTTGSKPLPVEFKAGTAALRSTTTWSRWGHPVTLRAPADAVPIASLAN
jgi:hypothetical protein